MITVMRKQNAGHHMKEVSWYVPSFQLLTHGITCHWRQAT